MVQMMDLRPDSLGRVRVKISADGASRVSFARLGALVANHATGKYDRILIGAPRPCQVRIGSVLTRREVAQTYVVPTTISIRSSARKAPAIRRAA